MSATNARSHRSLTDRLKAYPKEQALAIRRNLDVVINWRPAWRDGAEVLLLASALPMYYLVRGITNNSTNINAAVQRGIDIIELEQDMGIFWEAQMQGWILSYHWLVTFFNSFYLYGHLPTIGAMAVWMYFWHKPQYLLMRNAFLISGAIALIFYVNFPTAPPRLLPDHFGFVDTIYNQYQTGRPGTPSWFVNDYAAFPSMHIGWNLLVGISIWLASRNLFMRAFAVVMPLIMAVDIVFTANHYFLDIVAGVIVMLIGLGIAVWGRYFVKRLVSPVSKTAREKGWVPWLYWLFGVSETVIPGRRSAAQTA